MFNFILFWLALGSLVILFSTLSLRVNALRRGKVFPVANLSSYGFVQNLIDYFAFRLVSSLRTNWHRLALFVMVLVHRLISLLKTKLYWLEKRFVKLVDAIYGRGTVAAVQKESVSIFLREIEPSRSGRKMDPFGFARSARE